MKKFLLRISLFLSLFSGVYLIVFYCIHEGLRKSQYLDYTEWNAIYDGSINADWVIMGSSRAWKQVDPRIVDSTFQLNSYNLGIDGYHVPMQLTKFQIYQEHNSDPQKMIYIVDHFSLDKRTDLFNKDQFLPYLNDPVLASRLSEYEGFNWEHFHLPYYQYSGSKEICLAGFMEFFGIKKFAADKFKGYQPQYKVWEVDFDQEREENPNGKSAKVLPHVVNEFDLFIRGLAEQNIEVVLVYSPDQIDFQSYITNRDSVISIYRNLALKHNIPFIDFSNHPMCNDKTYFYNPTHLNTVGAELFTRTLCDSIKFIISNED